MERSMRGLKLAHEAAELVAWAEGAVEGVAEAHRYAEALEVAEAESRARAAEITSAIQRRVPPPPPPSPPFNPVPDTRIVPPFDKCD